jgi:hypothetical protein
MTHTVTIPKPNADCCAFAASDSEGNGPSGLTKREYFAGQALSGLCTVYSARDSAIVAVNAADALLAALENKPTATTKTV